MRQVIESFKRLYEKSILPKEKILALYENGKITEEEKKRIIFWVFNCTLISILEFLYI